MIRQNLLVEISADETQLGFPLDGFEVVVEVGSLGDVAKLDEWMVGRSRAGKATYTDRSTTHHPCLMIFRMTQPENMSENTTKPRKAKTKYRAVPSLALTGFSGS